MKKIIVVVDMQNDFISGSLGTEEARAIVPKIREYLESNKNKKIYFTRDTHYIDTYMFSNEGKNLPVDHCMWMTNGWEVIPELAEFVYEDNVFDKYTFGSTGLAFEIEKIYKHMEAFEFDQVLEIEIVGVCTDICVVSNALMIKAFCPEAEVSVVSNLCAGTTVENHEAALRTMKSCQINII